MVRSPRFTGLLSVVTTSLGLAAAIAITGPTIVPTLGTLPAQAQSSVNLTGSSLNASKNIARQAAERVNGGLNFYRAELAMHGPALESPYVDGGDVWIFTFQGGTPGEAVMTVETQVEVNKETLESVVVYNGPIRGTGAPSISSPSTSNPLPESPAASNNWETPELQTEATGRPPQSSQSALPAAGDINTAKNYARQAAERENGGLNFYRAEPSMHGPALESPYVDTGDAWVFLFRGGEPGSTVYSVETQVRVDKTTLETTVVYNRPVE